MFSPSPVPFMVGRWGVHRQKSEWVNIRIVEDTDVDVLSSLGIMGVQYNPPSTMKDG